jgi:hypothetical protein
MFSGRWDETLPRNEQGDFFIDCKAELFVPLLNFLRDLSLMPSPEYNLIPPVMPSFSSFSKEVSFHRMVDSFDLTNVLYNCEIIKHGNTLETFNTISVVSRNRSIFGYPIGTDSPISTSKIFYSLDRPTCKHGACHSRQEQAFKVALTEMSHCFTGWMRRGQAFASAGKHLLRAHNRLALACSVKCYFDASGDVKSFTLIKAKICRTCVFRCAKNQYTNEFEWYVDGVFVAATSRILEYGKHAGIDSVI